MAGFEEQIDDFDAAEVQIVAASADDEEGARKMKEEEGLSFPILHSLDIDEMEEKLGLYIEKGEKKHLQPAQFILRPDACVALASYSSGKVGRLSAEEALAEVESLREQADDEDAEAAEGQEEEAATAEA